MMHEYVTTAKHKALVRERVRSGRNHGFPDFVPTPGSVLDHVTVVNQLDDFGRFDSGNRVTDEDIRRVFLELMDTPIANGPLTTLSDDGSTDV
jgi:hypothetical protein